MEKQHFTTIFNTLSLLFFFFMCLLSFHSSAQQYSLTNIASNLQKFSHDTVGWGAGEMLLKTTVGIEWYHTDQEFLQTGAMMGVFFIDLENGWAVGTQGQIAYSNDGGNDWTRLEHDLSDQMLTGVLYTSPNNSFIIGDEKTLLKYGQTTGKAKLSTPVPEIWPNPTPGNVTIRSLSSETRVIQLLDITCKWVQNHSVDHPCFGTLTWTYHTFSLESTSSEYSLKIK